MDTMGMDPQKQKRDKYVAVLAKPTDLGVLTIESGD